MDNFIETIEYKGYSIHIGYDEYMDSPREWSNLSTLCLFHDNYSLPNEAEIDHRYFDSWEEMESYIWKEFDPLCVYPVSMYDHSGISFNIGNPTCQWDSGRTGFIFLKKEDVRREYNVKRITKNIKEIAIQSLKNEFDIYNEYIQGYCYYFDIENKDNEHVHYSSGFIGCFHEDSGLLDYAKELIDEDIERIRNEKYNKLKTLVKNRVPLELRTQLITQ